MTEFFKFELNYILYYAITALWLLEFAFFPSKFKASAYSEKRSFSFISVAIVLSILPTIILVRDSLFVLPQPYLMISNYIGLALYSIGITFRYVGTLTLDKYFTRGIEIETNHQLVSNGLYTYLRHPLYLGLFLLGISTSLVYGNYLMIIVSMLLMGSTLNYRMILEERAMEKIIGRRYAEWKAKRYRFIPFIY
jgi:protein-S-isoprenylcysteine O-methyltransferase Ste14